MWLNIRLPNGSTRSVEVADNRFVIGRDPGSDLVLDDAGVSRQHAVLERQPNGSIVLRDLGSSNGTHVNGHRIDPNGVLLVGGEEIRIGDTVVSPVEQGATAAPSQTPVERPPSRTAIQRLIAVALKEEHEETESARRSARVAVILAAIAVVLAVAIASLFATGVLPPGGDEQSASDVRRLVGPSTVLVIAKVDGERQGNGTGWVLDANEGLIVTNAHVINGGTEFTVGVNGREREATLVGNAPCEDLAVLKVTDTSNLKTLPLGTQDSAEEGETVVAIGFPGSASNRDQLTTTVGVVSVQRTSLGDPEVFDVPLYSNVILTDTAINPGNSGGPLVDLDAKLVGVNSAGGGGQNQNFAIGVDRVKSITADLREGRSVGWTGMEFLYRTSDVVDQLPDAGLPNNVAGLVVVRAAPGTPVADAGITLPALLIGVNGTTIDNRLQSYCELAGKGKSGETGTFEVVEPNATTSRSVSVGFE